ncbi:MAG: hypothetical protein Q9227_006799 [Pyrenula ochraceoflavens]
MPRLRLFNGKRPVFLKGPVSSKRIPYRKFPKGYTPPFEEVEGKLVSPDVAKFYQDLRAHDEELWTRRKKGLLRNPAGYFSWPEKVPLDLRKQVYLPDFTITLLRTPHLPPKYASFYVPLHFSKLDLRDLLLRAYSVPVTHIRSYIIQGKIWRSQSPYSDPNSRRSSGSLYRAPSQKKMTVELVEPFIWPEEIKDMSPWEKKEFFERKKFGEEQREMRGGEGRTKVEKGYAGRIAEQAKGLLEGRERWRPSWEKFPVDSWQLQRAPRGEETAAKAGS